MSQFTLPALNPTVHTGAQLTDWLNNWRDALHSSHSGAGRPSYVLPGTIWVDSSVANQFTLKLFDGTSDIPIGTFIKGSTTSPFFSSGGGALGGSNIVVYGATQNHFYAVQDAVAIETSFQYHAGFVLFQSAASGGKSSWFGAPSWILDPNPGVGYVHIIPPNTFRIPLSILARNGQSSELVKVTSEQYGLLYTQHNTGMIDVRPKVDTHPCLRLFANSIANPSAGLIQFFGSDGTFLGNIDSNMGFQFNNSASALTFHGYFGDATTWYQRIIYANPNWGQLAVTAFHQPTVEVGWRLSVGSIVFDFLNGGQIRTPTGQIVASDSRLKYEKEEITNPLTKVEHLKPYTYKRVDIKDVDGEPSTKRYAGLIAQEVAAVLPEAVSTYKGAVGDDTLALDHNGVVALLVGAVKELSEKVKVLTNRVNELEGNS